MEMGHRRVRRAARRGALRSPSTRPPLRRLFWTLGQLRDGRLLKATDVARQFEVDVRTAYRDIDFLRDQLRAPIEYDPSRGTYWLTDRTVNLPPLVMNQGEVIGLFFAEKVLAQYRGTPFEKDIASALRKLQDLMPEEVQVLPDRVLAYLSLDLGPLPPADPRIFGQVLASLSARRKLLVRYRSLSSGRTVDRVIAPYRVFNLRGDWYVAAFDERRRAVRDFALHRIRKATPTTESFQPDPGFDFDAYMADAFSIEKGARPVNVAIRFEPDEARWIRERRWHKTARIQERLDGGCVLRMRVAATSEIVRWVMQFGPEAEVLAPKGLRSRVAEALARALDPYKDRKRPTSVRRSERAGA
jgi:predicted DNA-binding transcriptional regulator YafY